MHEQLALKTVDLRKVPLDYRERAKEEAKLLRSLSHRHLVAHVNSYIRQPLLCMVTEYCRAGDLDKVVERLRLKPGLPERLIAAWLYQASSALHVSLVF